MSHFLLKHEVDRQSRWLDRPWACVTAEIRVGYRRPMLVVLQGTIGIAKEGTRVVPVPDRVQVVTEDGVVIKPARRLWVSVETFDPMHLVLDFDGS